MQQAMAKFIKWVLTEGPWQGGDLDGGAIQDEAEKLGLIVLTKYDPEIHGETDCEPGTDWYVLAPEIVSLTSG